MTGYIAVMVLAERAAYRANFRGAYEMSASGRISLAEHLRKLSLGFLGKRDPGDLSSMLITDFTMAETGISHYLPQLMGALVMPVLAFVSLHLVDWRMAVAMFVALPFAMGFVVEHERTGEAEWQADQSKSQCRKPPGRVPARHPGDESLQSAG